jgi:ABC-type multidrug transport system ATPase subunit
MSAALTLKGVVKTYGRRHALDGLDLEIPEGCICGLIGSNGAGKTTAMALVAGLIRPDSGTVDVLGFGPFDAFRHAGLLSLLPQDSVMPPESTIRELMEHYAQLQGVPEARIRADTVEAITRVHLADRLDAPVRTLSHGMRRRVMIAQAFLGAPPLVLLDEPMNGLDPREVAGARDLLAALRHRQTVLISSHNLDEIEKICDHVIFIEKGRTVHAGPLQSVTGNRQILQFELDGVDVPLARLHERLPLAEFALSDDRRNLRCRFDAETLTAPAVNRIVLAELLEAGTGIVSVRQGDGLEAVYLEQFKTP